MAPGAEIPKGFTRIPGGPPSAGLLVLENHGLPSSGPGSYIDALHKHGFLLFRGLEKLSPKEVVEFVGRTFPKLTPRYSVGPEAKNVVEGQPLAALGSLKDEKGNWIIDYVPASPLGAPLVGASLAEMEESLNRWLTNQEEATIQEWHADAVFTNNPPSYNLLLCKQPGGSRTGYADAVRGFQLLDAELQNDLKNAVVKFRPSIMYGNQAFKMPTIPSRRQQQSMYTSFQAEEVNGVHNRLSAIAEREAKGDVKDEEGNLVRDAVYMHRLLQPHPPTGEMAIRIEPKTTETLQIRDKELPAAEGQRLIWRMLRRVTQDDNAYQHVWAPGDMIIWDQRRMLHARIPYDAKNQDRLMWRMDFERDETTLSTVAREANLGQNNFLEPLKSKI